MHDLGAAVLLYEARKAPRAQWCVVLFPHSWGSWPSGVAVATVAVIAAAVLPKQS